jgi:protein ImuA
MNTRAPQNHTENKTLEKILQQHDSLRNKVWSGLHPQGSGKKSQQKTLATGYSKLDEALQNGGWPLTTTTELCFSQPGIGELRLLMPALAELQKSTLQKSIVWLAPPFLPFAPALAREKIDAAQLTIVQTNSMQDTLWAAEQLLLAECCAAVFTWTGNYNLSVRELRRLQLAAEKSNTWNVLFRHSDCLKQPSVSGLRLHLKSNSYSQLDVHILKQSQSWGGQHCTLSLRPHYENWQRLPAHLLPQKNSDRQYAAFQSESINDLSSTDHKQASVTVLASFGSIRLVH